MRRWCHPPGEGGGGGAVSHKVELDELESMEKDCVLVCVCV